MDIEYYQNWMAKLIPAILAEKDEFRLKIYLKCYVRCIVEIWYITHSIELN